jgi:hypothetical protein
VIFAIKIKLGRDSGQNGTALTFVKIKTGLRRVLYVKMQLKPHKEHSLFILERQK